MGTRTHLSPVQHPAGGQPYLVTRSTSGAGGADGASQTSETVFARSAVSTFGTGVALGEEGDGGLPGEVPSRVVTPAFPLPFAQQHRRTPGSSSSLGSSSSSQAPGEELGSAPSKGLSPRAMLRWGQRWHRASPPQGAAAHRPWLRGAHSAPKGRWWGAQGWSGVEKQGGDIRILGGHVLCHPWRLAGRQHHALRAYPADRGGLGSRGHREHQHHPGQERKKTGVSENPALPRHSTFLPGFSTSPSERG